MYTNDIDKELRNLDTTDFNTCNIRLFGFEGRDWASLSDADKQKAVQEDAAKYWTGNEEDRCFLAKHMMKNSKTFHPIRFIYNSKGNIEVFSKGRVRPNIVLPSTTTQGYFINGTVYIPRIAAIPNKDIIHTNTGGVVLGYHWVYAPEGGMYSKSYLMLNKVNGQRINYKSDNYNNLIGKIINEDPDHKGYNKEGSPIKWKFFSVIQRDMGGQFYWENTPKYDEEKVLTPKQAYNMLDEFSLRLLGLYDYENDKERDWDYIDEEGKTTEQVFIEKINDFKDNPIDRFDIRNYRYYSSELLYREIVTDPIFRRSRNVYNGIRIFEKLAAENNSFFIIAKPSNDNWFNSRQVVRSSVKNQLYGKNGRKYINGNNFFDPYYTQTSKKAGYQKMILNDVKVSNTMLYRNIDDKFYDMFQIIASNKLFSNFNPFAKFAANDAAKRQAMATKIQGQIVKLEGDKSGVNARVVFGNVGYTIGDGFIISRSFADKISSINYKNIQISNIEDRTDIVRYAATHGGELDLQYVKEHDDIFRNLSLGYPSKITMVRSPNNAGTMEIAIYLAAREGDKISNNHGNKGVIVKVLEDKDMPYDEDGPFDVIVNGIQTIGRHNPGQIADAWASYNHIEKHTKFIQDAANVYKEEIDKQPIHTVYYQDFPPKQMGTGLMYFVRLDHDAYSKISASKLSEDGDSLAKKIKFGEMEYLDLEATDSTAIKDEIAMLSRSRSNNTQSLEERIVKTGHLPLSPNNTEWIAENNDFYRTLQALGITIRVDGESLNHERTPDDKEIVSYNNTKYPSSYIERNKYLK